MGYILLNEYSIHGKINTAQIHSFDAEKTISKEFINWLCPEDFPAVK